MNQPSRPAAYPDVVAGQPNQPMYAVPPVPAYARPTNGLAIAALVTALCGLVIIPIILGHAALAQIRRRGESGEGLALVGLVLGYLQLLLVVGFLVMTGAGIWWAVTAG